MVPGMTPPDRDTVSRTDRALVLTRDGTPVGRLDWRLGAEAIHIDYVHVDPALRGHGLGRWLVDAAVANARDTGRRIVPVCGYARRVLQSDPSYADVFRGSPHGEEGRRG